MGFLRFALSRKGFGDTPWPDAFAIHLFALVMIVIGCTAGMRALWSSFFTGFGIGIILLAWYGTWCAYKERTA